MARAASPRATVDRPGVVPTDGTGAPWALTGRRVMTPDRGAGIALYCTPYLDDDGTARWGVLVLLDTGGTRRYPPRKIRPEETS